MDPAFPEFAKIQVASQARSCVKGGEAASAEAADSSAGSADAPFPPNTGCAARPPAGSRSPCRRSPRRPFRFPPDRPALPQPVMKDRRLPDILPRQFQLLQKQHLSQRPAVVLCQKLFIRHIFIQIARIPADPSPVKLLQQEALHLSPVGLIKLRKLRPVLLHIGVQGTPAAPDPDCSGRRNRSARCGESPSPPPGPANS